jgi:hypothetical protein
MRVNNLFTWKNSGWVEQQQNSTFYSILALKELLTVVE